MPIGELIHDLPHPTKYLIRQIEKLNKKITTNKLSQVFNRICLQENILPTYTNIRTHDPAARDEQITVDYRIELIKRQIRIRDAELIELEHFKSDCLLNLERALPRQDHRHPIIDELNELREQFNNGAKIRMTSKLNRLYRGDICLPEETDCFINLSDHTLTENQRKLLNLGLNCHLQPKFNKTKKKIELELLYESILSQESKQTVTIHPDLREQLRGESTKQRCFRTTKIISPELRQAANELKQHPDIVIRKADKANIYVILNKDSYMTKLNVILNDRSKFKPIARDPTEQLQRKANKLISSANALVGQRLLTPIVGSYTPGYIYGNVKTHKNRNPLRPIISQVTSPMYKISKQLDNIIKPYIPKKYSINSRDEFLEILQTTRPQGLLASLDADSLFTNVPVEETIQIILQNVYHGSELAPSLPKPILEQLLRCCTTESPFRSPDNKLYYQCNGIAMGNPLGPTFSEFYMCDLENKVLNNEQLKPATYCRYVDDVFVVVRNEGHLKELQQQMQSESVLTFSYELSVNGKIPFLDITVESIDGQFQTSVHRKPTDLGKCMHPNSECPERYKDSAIRAYIHRAYKTCSSQALLQSELRRTKQILVNNGYSNRKVDQEINRCMESFNALPTNSDRRDITLYYCNQMSSAHKTDERVLQEIVKRNVRCTSPGDTLKLVVYYKSSKTHQLVMNNNPTRKRDRLHRTNVLYQFTCPEEGCRLLPNIKYIGMTTTTLSRRMTCHLSSGAPKQHMRDAHQVTLTRTMMEDNTQILTCYTDPVRLAIAEAIYIKDIGPAVNLQAATFTRTLKLYDGRTT